MHGADEGETLAGIVPWEHVPQSALAYDLIDNPAVAAVPRAREGSGPPCRKMASACWSRRPRSRSSSGSTSRLLGPRWRARPERSLLAGAKREASRFTARRQRKARLAVRRDRRRARALAEKEWLHTNGAGAYAMSTIAMMHTRRHHGAFYRGPRAAARPPRDREPRRDSTSPSMTIAASIALLHTNSRTSRRRRAIGCYRALRRIRCRAGPFGWAATRWNERCASRAGRTR